MEGHNSKVEDLISPYSLPREHPTKVKLDKIFSEQRAIFNLDTLQKAGFAKSKPRKFTELVVTRHPKIPGYIFKIYLDCQRFPHFHSEHHFWIKRIKGANKIRQIIRNSGLQNQFKVPRKWIYLLPEWPLAPRGYYKKHSILVEEDMQILPKIENDKKWASNQVTKKLLRQLYRILNKAGLSDGAKPDNIPFSIDGRIAFIDTQSYNEKVKYHRLTRWLSKENQHYWKKLTVQGQRT